MKNEFEAKVVLFSGVGMLVVLVVALSGVLR